MSKDHNQDDANGDDKPAEPAKVYGELKYHSGWWSISMVPHVALRFKRIFPKAEPERVGRLTLKDNVESRHDLLWFIDRYPLKISPADLVRLKDGRKEYVEGQKAFAEIVAGDGSSDLSALEKFALGRPLRLYQRQAVALAKRRKRLLLADDVGLGKTASSIGLMADRECLPALVVTQTHLVAHWESQLKMFLPDATTWASKGRSLKDFPKERKDVYITTYSRMIGWDSALARDCNQSHRSKSEPALGGFFKAVIFDEMQELRREGTSKYDVASLLASAAEYVMGLSATPIYNFGDEIFYVLDLIENGVLGSRNEFLREWCSFDFSKSRQVVKDPVALRSFLDEKSIMLRRRREDVALELPKMSKQIVELVTEDDSLADAIRDSHDLALRVMMGTFTEKGQAARELDMKMRLASGVAKAKPTAAFVKTLLDSGESVLLIGWHRAVYEIWLKELAEYSPVMFTGSETGQEKESSKARFIAGETKLMIMSLRSGIGVDGLQHACRTVVFGELDWSPAVHEQCAGRLDRFGQKSPVIAYYMIADRGCDPVMVDILGLKAAQADGIMRDVGQMSAAQADGVGESAESAENSLKGAQGGRVKELAKSLLKNAGIKLEEMTSNDNHDAKQPLQELKHSNSHDPDKELPPPISGLGIDSLNLKDT